MVWFLDVDIGDNMGTTNENKTIAAPNLNSTVRINITTGHTDEAVVLGMPLSVNTVLFSPYDARMMAARLLELADYVDGGQGVS